MDVVCVLRFCPLVSLVLTASLHPLEKWGTLGVGGHLQSQLILIVPEVCSRVWNKRAHDVCLTFRQKNLSFPLISWRQQLCFTPTFAYMNTEGMTFATHSFAATFPQCQNNPSRQQRAEQCHPVYSEKQNRQTWRATRQATHQTNLKQEEVVWECQ